MSIRPLSAELQKIAEGKLNEDSARIGRDIEHLREWLRQQPHLETIKLEDQWLLAFLRGCKHNLQKTKAKLELFYSIKNVLPEFFHNKDPFRPEIQQVLKAGVMSSLPWIAAPDSPKVVFFRVHCFDPSVISFEDIVKVAAMALDILLLEDDYVVINGLIIVLDLTGITVDHIMLATFANVSKIVACFQRSYPSRPQGIYFVNAPKVIETVYAGLKHITTQKLRDKIKFVQWSELETLLSSNAVPKKYGGKLTSFDEINGQLKERIEGYKQWFLQEESNCSNESLRIGESKTVDNIFGVEGSFRQLDID